MAIIQDTLGPEAWFPHVLGVNAKRFDMVAAWLVDRLGRSLTDLLGILQGLQDKGVDLFLHQQGLD
ncbi:recombinase family protein, partial [Bradyrhizobium sp.]|uniref:recombinase family protein n=1 Tax=Bradyrhizobium sp. TaxID=376 RepID=UPI0025C4802A